MKNAKQYPYTDDAGVLHIRYQDTYDFGRDVQSVTDVSITSFVTGTDEKDADLLIVREGKTVYADGCGTATVLLVGGEAVKVKVDPSPINMLFVTGQSNASGDPQGNLKEGFPEQYYRDYIGSPETMAYISWTGQQVSIDPEGDLADYAWAVENGGTLWPPYIAHAPSEEEYAQGLREVKFHDYHKYVPTTLDWESARTSGGPQPQALSDPKEKRSFRLAGWNAALAYEWVKQTNERVWIVNCAQGGMEIQQFQPSEDGHVINNEYYQAVAVFNLALQTLYREVDAGHFVLNHMVYYWFHGESNSNYPEIPRGEYTGWDNRFKRNRGNRYLDAEAYAAYFAKTHAGFMRDVVYDHAGVRHELEFCGIMTVRSADGERANTYDQIKLTGPRNAEYYAGATAEEPFRNVFVVSNVTEQWVGASYDAELGVNPEADANVKKYMLRTYGTPANFERIFGYPMPETVYEMHPGVHYLMHGHNEMGMDCARNSLRILGLLDPENSYELPHYGAEERARVRMIGEDGRIELTDAVVFDKKTLKASVCPRVTPLSAQVKGLTVEVTGGNFTFNANVFTAASEEETLLRFKVYLGGELYGEYAFSVEYR